MAEETMRMDVTKVMLTVYANSLKEGDVIKAPVYDVNANSRSIKTCRVVNKYPFLCEFTYNTKFGDKKTTAPWIDIFVQNYSAAMDVVNSLRYTR